MLKSPKGFQFFREGVRTLSLDPRILILVECTNITEKLTGMLRIKSNKLKTIIMNPVQFAYVL